MIKIIDDFLCHDMAIYLEDIIVNLNYRIDTTVGGTSLKEANFLNSVGQFPNHDVFTFVANKISNLNFISVHSFLRAYVNLHPAGEQHSGSLHTDDGKITALLYPIDFGCNGEEGGTEVEGYGVVEYKRNRLLLFDAHLQHRALPHYQNKFRYSLAYKMEANWL